MAGLGRFGRDDRGTTAVLFGLALIPIAGVAGIALDYGRATALRGGLQKAADHTALTYVIAAHEGRVLDVERTFKAALGPMALKQLESGAASGALTVSGNWRIANREYEVRASGPLGGSVIQALLPNRAVDVGVRAAAIGTQVKNAAKIEGANLDPEAADYNETQAYCYDDVAKERRGPLDPETGKRLPFQKIADNTDEGVKAPPANLNVVCGEREQVSFLVKNIREARTSPLKQATVTPRSFYTDAVRDVSGQTVYTVTFDGQVRNTLETILCATKSECKPSDQGGILPRNHQINRSPATMTRACKAGEYIYFGWEDRIPGYSGDNSDRDFDDIRMMMTCPTQSSSGPFMVRLSI